MAHRTASIAAVVLTVAAVAAVPPAFGETDKDEQAKPEVSPYAQATGGGKTAPAKVYSNEDLRRLFGGDSIEEVDAEKTDSGQPEARVKARPKDSAKTAADPLQLMEAQKRQRQQREEAVQKAEQKLAAARQALTDLEKRTRALRSPYMAKPGVPEGEDAASWGKMSTRERLERNQKDEEKAREAIREAEQALSRARNSNR